MPTAIFDHVVEQNVIHHEHRKHVKTHVLYTDKQINRYSVNSVTQIGKTHSNRHYYMHHSFANDIQLEMSAPPEYMSEQFTHCSHA